MPNYEYQCDCGHTFNRLLSMARRNEPEGEPCPICKETGTVKKVILTPPGLVDPVRLGLKKPDGSFREMLHKIHENTPGSQLNKTATHF